MVTVSNVNEFNGDPIDSKRSMNVLWLCNIMLPRIGKILGQPYYSIGGWLTGMSEELAKTPDINLTVIFPQSFSQSLISGKTELYSFYGFPKDIDHQTTYSANVETVLADILDKVQPDIVHIFGTENIHSNAMINACIKKEYIDHTVVSIQGLISQYSDYYYADLPNSVINRYTFRDYYKHNGLKEQKNVFIQQGQYEVDTIKKAKHVIGRTDWDRKSCIQYNPNICYHYCNETLRSTFYENAWSYGKCQQHSIFLSQVNYPIKGFHKVIQAMPKIIKQYPDTQIYTTGPDLLHLGLAGMIKQTSYVKYLRELINKNGLTKHITFLGILDEQKMCNEYIKSNVFICPSSIENSSNSIGEAMLLGTPVIASNVGGTSSILGDNAYGQLYPFQDTEALADAVIQIFSVGKDAEMVSLYERNRAKKLYDPKKNNDCLIQIYNTILKS